MSEGLAATFRVLGSTENETAAKVLIAALDSPKALIRESAVAALLSRPDPRGHREVLRRLHDLSGEVRQLLLPHSGRMTDALREAVLHSDGQLCANACQAVVWFREYDLTASLIEVMENASNPNADLAAESVLTLSERLHEELVGPREDLERRDPEMVRDRMVGALEGSVRRFGRHERVEVLESFLRLTKCDNVTFRQVLSSPHEAAFLALVELLKWSDQPSVIRLLLSLLDDRRSPTVALNTIMRRRDLKFVRLLLSKIGAEPTPAVRENLGRIKSIAWIEDGLELLGELDEAHQEALVRLIANSRIPGPKALVAVDRVLRFGETAGRRAAVEALGHFDDSEWVKNMILRALEDLEASVQAAALWQLRGKGIREATSRVIAMVDSPNPVIRRAARGALIEFNFERFLAAFDSLDEEVRRTTGPLVRKVDPQAIQKLKAEMQSVERSHRLRAIGLADAMGAVIELEDMLIERCGDSDHLIRLGAIEVMARCDSHRSLRVLREALKDRSPAVCEAAEEAIQRRERRSKMSDKGNASKSGALVSGRHETEVSR